MVGDTIRKYQSKQKVLPNIYFSGITPLEYTEREPWYFVSHQLFHLAQIKNQFIKLFLYENLFLAFASLFHIGNIYLKNKYIKPI